LTFVHQLQYDIAKHKIPTLDTNVPVPENIMLDTAITWILLFSTSRWLVSATLKLGDACVRLTYNGISTNMDNRPSNVIVAPAKIIAV